MRIDIEIRLESRENRIEERELIPVGSEEQPGT
jgi:hypothetical protein